MPTVIELVGLTAAALTAGFIDAIAGGGGLITVPALLSVGLPPHLALGTNKAQSVFGSGAALVRFAREGLVSAERAWPLLCLGFGGALVGAHLATELEATVLRPVIMAMLVAVAPLAFVRAKTGIAPRRFSHVLSLAIALVVGCYDGFFGPGTGTLLVLGFAALGRPLVSATAEAKVVNFASNLAALLLFAHRGYVVLAIALPMAAAQLIGGHVGARAAVRGGERVVRAALIGVMVALLLKLSFDLWIYGA